MRSQALSVVAIGALLATTLVLSHETPAKASPPEPPDPCALDSPGHNPGWAGAGIRDISSKNDLIWLSLNPSGNLAAEYRLTTDINLGDCVWTPIDPFTGGFDGGGHEISRLKVDAGDAGLFSAVEGSASIKNLRLVDVDIKAANGGGALASGIEGSNIVIRDVFISGTVDTRFSGGGLAGFVEGATIENVRSEAEVTCSSLCGGLIGELEDSEVLRSSATGEVTGEDEVGGLVGYQDAGSSISYSFSTGPVRTGTGKNGKAGGLVGYQNADSSISYSFSTGPVRTGSATSSKAGGLVGDLQGTVIDSYARGVVEAGAGDRPRGGFTGIADGGSIQRGYSTGEVSPPSGTGVGGFIGALGDTDPTVTASVWDTQTSGLGSSAGGDGVVGRTTAQMTSFDTFGPSRLVWAIVEGWQSFLAPDDGVVNPAIHRVWGICPAGSDNLVNDGYPFLLWEYESDPCVNPPDPAPPTGPAPDPDPKPDPITQELASKEAPAATRPEKRAGSAGIHLDLQATVGGQVLGAPVVVGGEGLAAGSFLTLVVRSTPQTLVSGRVSDLGNFSTRATLPALSPGSHTLTLTGTAPDGAVLSLAQNFVVGADGTFVSIGQPTGSQTGGLAATGVPANAGVLFSVASLMLLAIGLSLLRARSRPQFTD